MGEARGEASRLVRLGAASVVLASVALFLTPTPASTHFQTYWYTHAEDAICVTDPDDYRAIDPINIVFTQYADGPAMIRRLETVAGWYNSGGSEQWFTSHCSSGPKFDQRSDSGTANSRYHIRVKKTYHEDPDPALHITGRGDAHHEDIVVDPRCENLFGHAVDKNGPEGSGFDMGREKLREIFELQGYEFWYSPQGNDRLMQQCDQDLASSDGWVVFIKLPLGSPPTGVNIAGFRAVEVGVGVRLVWRAVGARIGGFSVWRRGPRGYRKLDSKLIPYRRGSTDATYNYIDRSARAPGVYDYKLQVVNLDGSREWVGPTRVVVKWPSLNASGR